LFRTEGGKQKSVRVRRKTKLQLERVNRKRKVLLEEVVRAIRSKTFPLATVLLSVMIFMKLKIFEFH